MRNVVSALVLALIVLLSGGLTVVFLCKIRDDAARAKCANRLKQHWYRPAILPRRE